MKCYWEQYLGSLPPAAGKPDGYVSGKSSAADAYQVVVHRAATRLFRTAEENGSFADRTNGWAIPATGYRPEDCCDTGVFDASDDSAETDTLSGVWMRTEGT